MKELEEKEKKRKEQGKITRRIEAEQKHKQKKKVIKNKKDGGKSTCNQKDIKDDI